MIALLDGDASPMFREEERISNDTFRFYVKGAASVAASDYRPLTWATGAA